LIGFGQCGLTFICVNTIGSYSCQCPPGYLLNANGTLCVDIDECLQNLNNCTQPSQRCINLPGSFQCECNSPAFISTVNGCVDNDECLSYQVCLISDPSSAFSSVSNLSLLVMPLISFTTKLQFNCPEYSTCLNTLGSYKCACDQGFRPEIRGDIIVRCVDINECEEQPDACPRSAKCKNRIGSYECECMPPSIQHGLRDCVVNTSCPNECSEHAYCLKSERPDGAVYNCTCDVGYAGDGAIACLRMCIIHANRCFDQLVLISSKIFLCFHSIS
uniref:EGF-like domain-containing protein n=1 Tax=Anisakis simplex TaxID=6269 RepID=A0A0M3J506_ANISI